MGRGAFEHRFRHRELEGLGNANPEPDVSPVLIYQSDPRAASKGSTEVSADLYCGDNEQLLPEFAAAPKPRFDLIYLDPPFGTGQVFKARVGGSRSRSALNVEAYRDDDRFDDYLDWLEARLALCRDLLEDRGTLYVHLDWHSVHYVKVRLDRIFGRERFLNELIWCYHGPNPIKSAFKRKHDTILVYTKSADYFFDADAVRVPYDPSTVKTFRSSSKAGFGKTPNLERGKVPEDWWYFPVVARMHSERVGYETQKPLALLDRIVRASSPAGGLVGDFFGGSGTTAVSAVRLGRSAILCDSNPTAIGKSLDRLEDLPERPTTRVWRFLNG